MELKTLDNALNVLECFTQDTPSLGLRELSRRLDMNHTVVYRIVSTFERRGYLIKDSETNKYRLGLKVLEHAIVLQDQLSLSEIINSEMQKLSDATGESIVLTWLDRTEAVYIAVSESSQQVRFSQAVGGRSPLYIGASHKTILAYLPESVIEDVIATMPTEQDPERFNPPKLRMDLEKIRLQGWCYSSGENLSDVAALSVPLFDRKDKVIASLSIASPSFRFPKEVAKESLPLLLESGQKIHEILMRHDLKGVNIGTT